MTDRCQPVDGGIKKSDALGAGTMHFCAAGCQEKKVSKLHSIAVRSAARCDAMTDARWCRGLRTRSVGRQLTVRSDLSNEWLLGRRGWGG